MGDLWESKEDYDSLWRALKGYIRLVGYHEGVDFIPDKFETPVSDFMDEDSFLILKEVQEEAIRESREDAS